MIASAVHTRPAPVSARAPAVASVAVRPLLASADAHGEVLGVSSHAVWIRTGEDIVVVSTRDATRLPNSVEIALDASTDPFVSIEHGGRAALNPTSIVLRGLTVEVVRWWDARPALPSLRPAELAIAYDRLPSAIAPVASKDLRHALATASADSLCDAAASLLGQGSGLTPEGDDYLAGALAATRTLGSAIGSNEALEMLDACEGRLARFARRATTTFSAALIRCALRGEVAAPAGAFLRSLAGRGDVATTHRHLRSVGHTSGPALAAGIVLGAQSLVDPHTTPHGGFQ